MILQEIAAAMDSPEDIVFDLVQEAAFPDQPVGRPILGTAKSVSLLQARPSRRLSLDPLSRAEHGAGGGWRRRSCFARRRGRAASHVVRCRGIAEPERRRLCRVASGARRKPFEQTHLVLAFEAPPYRHADYFTAQICAGALGGGMSSRLFQEVRERRGLCYAIYAFASGLVRQRHVRDPCRRRTRPRA